MQTEEVVSPGILITCILLLLILFIRNKKRSNIKLPPAPFKLPIIGHLHHMRHYVANPWEGFDAIRKKYGDLVRLQMGNYSFALVSSVEMMREILITKGDLFADRPHFERYNRVFGGDQENALALCNWSEMQKIRRNIAQMYIIPRYGSKLHCSLDKIIQKEVISLLPELKHSTVLTKMHLLLSVFNIFTDYLCSTKFSKKDIKFRQQAINYDIVFYDINQCYPFDFLPWLTWFRPFRKQLNQLQKICTTLTSFIEDEVVIPRYKQMKDSIEAEGTKKPKDFLEYNLDHHRINPVKFNWNFCLFEIGDVVGGNSAVSNLVMRLLGFLALNPLCQSEILREANEALLFDREHVCVQVSEDCDELNSGCVTLKHRTLMPYMEACIMEVLRLTSSPIVPHVASQNTTIGGMYIEKGTHMMFNCYYLNLNENYYKNPRSFNPMRFLVPRNSQSYGQKDSYNDCTMANNSEYACPFGRATSSSNGGCVTGVKPNVLFEIQKPDNYFPFSWGKRSCLGYKMVQTIVFSLVANLVLNFELQPTNEQERAKIEFQLTPKGCLALPVEDCFELKLVPRNEL